MCGIIGYIGQRNAYPIVLNGLKRLEYRGYDSAGVGLITEGNNNIVTYKQAGKVDDLLNYIMVRSTIFNRNRNSTFLLRSYLGRTEYNYWNHLLLFLFI